MSNTEPSSAAESAHAFACQRILAHSAEGARVREAFFHANAERLAEVSRLMASAIAGGKKLLFCGNGGSAADSQHLAAEFVNRFVMERPPLPAIALTTDSSILTSIGNDYSFDEVFSKQVQALGQAGDILIALSTSGNSKNVILALEAARKRGVICVGVTGKNGGAMAGLCDYLLNVENAPTALVQEVHIAIGHMMCTLVDYYLFENVLALQAWEATR